MIDPVKGAAIDRTLRTYFLMNNLSDEAAREAREKLSQYMTLLYSAGERDLDRLTMCGLTFLRDNEQGARPDGARSRSFTGL